MIPARVSHNPIIGPGVVPAGVDPAYDAQYANVKGPTAHVGAHGVGRPFSVAPGPITHTQCVSRPTLKLARDTPRRPEASPPPSSPTLARPRGEGFAPRDEIRISLDAPARPKLTSSPDLRPTPRPSARPPQDPVRHRHDRHRVQVQGRRDDRLRHSRCVSRGPRDRAAPRRSDSTLVSTTSRLRFFPSSRGTLKCSNRIFALKAATDPAPLFARLPPFPSRFVRLHEAV